MHVRKDDMVVVISGNHKGATGRVLNIDREWDRVTVQGVNKRMKWLKKTQENPKGGQIEQEFPIHISNVALWDEDSSKVLKKRPKETKE